MGDFSSKDLTVANVVVVAAADTEWSDRGGASAPSDIPYSVNFTSAVIFAERKSPAWHKGPPARHTRKRLDGHERLPLHVPVLQP